MSKNVLIICGYARTGKTSLISELSEEDWSVASSSNILTEVCEEILRVFDRPSVDFKSKTGQIVAGSYLYTPRAFKISIAEKVIVPILGREAMINASFRCCYKDNIVCESIGGAELDMYLSYIRVNYPGAKVLVLNMRSALELKGVDIRELATKEQCQPHVLKEYVNLFIPFRGLKDYFNEFFGIKNDRF
jgi:hypothetical protein